MSTYMYCDGSELALRYDKRRLMELYTDDGVRPTSYDAYNANLLAALEDATAEINAAIFIGYKYTAAGFSPTTFLSGLTDTGQRLIRRLAADLAYANLVSRRGLSTTETSNLAPRNLIAQQMLEQLRQGERIFDMVDQSSANAGIAHHAPLGISDISNTGIVTSSFPYFGILPVVYPNRFN
jgi:hypothetical protein